MAIAAVVSFCCLAVDATAAPRACTANARSSPYNEVLCMKSPVSLHQPSALAPFPSVSCAPWPLRGVRSLAEARSAHRRLSGAYLGSTGKLVPA